MKILKNKKLNLVLFIDFKKKKGILLDENSAGHTYGIDIQYNTCNQISKIRLV